MLSAVTELAPVLRAITFPPTPVELRLEIVLVEIDWFVPEFEAPKLIPVIAP